MPAFWSAWVLLLGLILWLCSRRCVRKLEAFLLVLVLATCLELSREAYNNKQEGEKRARVPHYLRLDESQLISLGVPPHHSKLYLTWTRQRLAKLPPLQEVHREPFKGFESSRLNLTTASKRDLVDRGGCRDCADRILQYRNTPGVDMHQPVPFFNRLQASQLRLREVGPVLVRFKLDILLLVASAWVSVAILNLGESTGISPFILPTVVFLEWMGILTLFSGLDLGRDGLIHEEKAGLAMVGWPSMAVLGMLMRILYRNWRPAHNRALLCFGALALMSCLVTTVAGHHGRLSFSGVALMPLALGIYTAAYFAWVKPRQDEHLLLGHVGPSQTILKWWGLAPALAVIFAALLGPSERSLGDLGSSMVMGVGVLLFAALISGREWWGLGLLLRSAFAVGGALLLAVALNLSVVQERITLWFDPFGRGGECPNAQTILTARAWLAMMAAGGRGLGGGETLISDSLSDFSLCVLAGYCGPGLTLAVCLGFALLTLLFIRAYRGSALPFHAYLCAFAGCSLGGAWILLSLSNFFAIPCTGYPLIPLAWARTHTCVFYILIAATLLSPPGPGWRSRLESPLVPVGLMLTGWTAVLVSCYWWSQADRLAEIVRPGRREGDPLCNKIYLERYQVAPPLIEDRNHHRLVQGGHVIARELTTLLDSYLSGPAPCRLENPDLWNQPGFNWRAELPRHELEYLIHPLRRPLEPDRIVLTLDRDLTVFAVGLLQKQGKRGLIVVTENKSGDVLCAATYPDLNPTQARLVKYRADKLESGKLTGEERNLALHEKSQEILWDATCLQFSPASTFKPVVCLAACRYLNLTNLKFDCDGKECMGHVAHGQDIDMVEALTHSCNRWQRLTAQKVTAPRLNRESHQLGFTGDISPANLPSSALGQASVKVSAPRLACFYGGLMTTGMVMIPRLELSQVRGGQFDARPTRLQADLRDLNLTEIRAGLRGVIERGTASRAFRDFGPEPVIGKTGTAENNDGLNTAIFVGSTPRHTVVVWLDRAGSGGAKAAPIARKLLDRMRNYH